jgi:hypothetical protein
MGAAEVIERTTEPRGAGELASSVKSGDRSQSLSGGSDRRRQGGATVGF